MPCSYISWISFRPARFRTEFRTCPVIERPDASVVRGRQRSEPPTAMAFIGAGDILVLQKNDGRVRRVINGTLQSAAVLDLTVENDSERGLLGIAVHPNFNSNKFVYLYFTHSGTTCGSTPRRSAGKSSVPIFLGWERAGRSDTDH